MNKPGKFIDENIYGNLDAIRRKKV